MTTYLARNLNKYMIFIIQDYFYLLLNLQNKRNKLETINYC